MSRYFEQKRVKGKRAVREPGPRQCERCRKLISSSKRETPIVRVTATGMWSDARGDVSGVCSTHTWYYHPDCWERQRVRGAPSTSPVGRDHGLRDGYVTSNRRALDLHEGYELTHRRNGART